MRSGDTLVVTKLDRLARSLRDAREIADELTAKGVALSLGGSRYDPTDPVRRLLFNVLAMVAEFERDLSSRNCPRRNADFCWRRWTAASTPRPSSPHSSTSPAQGSSGRSNSGVRCFSVQARGTSTGPPVRVVCEPSIRARWGNPAPSLRRSPSATPSRLQVPGSRPDR